MFPLLMGRAKGQSKYSIGEVDNASAAQRLWQMRPQGFTKIWTIIGSKESLAYANS
jgi:hypothetical protein